MILDFIKKHFLEILCCDFVLLFAFWSIGYFMNALYGAHFDLASCWGGFTALGGAGFLATVKYIMDSKYNSIEGASPYKESIIKAEEIIKDGVEFLKKEVGTSQNLDKK